MDDDLRAILSMAKAPAPKRKRERKPKTPPVAARPRLEPEDRPAGPALAPASAPASARLCGVDLGPAGSAGASKLRRRLSAFVVSLAEQFGATNAASACQTKLEKPLPLDNAVRRRSLESRAGARRQEPRRGARWALSQGKDAGGMTMAALCKAEAGKLPPEVVWQLHGAWVRHAAEVLDLESRAGSDDGWVQGACARLDLSFARVRVVRSRSAASRAGMVGYLALESARTWTVLPERSGAAGVGATAPASARALALGDPIVLPKQDTWLALALPRCGALPAGAVLEVSGDARLDQRQPRPRRRR